MSKLFIERPVMTTLVMLGLFLFGVVAYEGLPVSDLPNVDFPTIQVGAALPGASPDTMASSVATPLERQFSTIAGLDSMTSQNAQGITSITLQFNLSRNIDAAAQDVQAAITAAARTLPPNLPTPPSYQKVNPADQPILYLALTSPSLPLSELDEYGETMMAQRISTISGVAQVLVYGSQKYAVRVQMDPKALATTNIGIDEVANAVNNQNVNLPTGTLYGPHTAYTVQANGQLTQAKAYRNLIVAYRNGNPVRLDQLGRVIDSVENDKTAAWYSGDRSVILAIQRQPGTNTVEVAGAVKAMLPRVAQQLPASVSLHVLYDRSESIQASVEDVKFTLGLTLALVVLVIFLFLRNVRATVIPSLALPMSLVGTFIVLYLLGYQLDNLSLMAITLSVGFVVDDAIVMLENIVRHIEHGEGVMEASLKGSREIGFTILSMTISLAAVFIPVLFMGGIIGRLFHEFSVAIGASILVSGFISLSLTPMLCSRFLKPHAEQHHGRLYDLTERGFNWGLRVYERGLKWSLNHRRSVMVFSLLVLILTVPMCQAVPKGFLPSEDVGMLIAFTESQEGISFDALVKNQKQVAEIVGQDPNVKEYMSSAGSRGATGSNQGIVFMHLKPRDKRALSADQTMDELRPKLGGIPGMRVYLQNPPPIRIGGQFTKAQYQYTLQDADTKELYRVSPILEQKMRALPALQDVNSDLQLKNPQIEVNIDREKAAALGVTPMAVENALYTSFGTRQISTIYAPTNEYQVIMELLPEYQADPASMQLIYVRSSNGSLVPLDAVATLSQDLGPLTIQHAGQLPSVTLSFNLRPGHSIGEAVNDVNKLALQTLPATVSTSFQGTAQAFQSSLQGLGVLFILAVAVIYLVLGILYESFIHPLTILSALPFAGFGALLTLLVFRTEMSIYAMVGIIMLVGLVKKNGIMMIDFAIEAQKADPHRTPADAIYEACVVRFRPIMMTTFAALMGTLPIALGYGAGAESRRPLGLAVVGGLVFSQMLTLYVTPVFYTYAESFRLWIGRKRAVPAPAAPAT
ncbi:MAG TPA: efflux RND transporter permease subunit [Myxococcales bacterium]|nr:efflux RND transporter permease subunit [Myxococcales bacterium]